MPMVDEKSLDIIWRNARTHNGWLNKPVPESLLKEIYELAKMGATSVNCCPMRIVFVTSKAAKEKLKPALSEGNIEKTMSAPVTAIIGMDLEFYQHLPTLFPHTDARSWFTGNATFAESTAFRNSSLQGAYFMLAARAKGLDCGPMSGFDNDKLDKIFFVGTKVKSNFLCNLGYGDSTQLQPRGKRLDFKTVCRVE